MATKKTLSVENLSNMIYQVLLMDICIDLKLSQHKLFCSQYCWLVMLFVRLLIFAILEMISHINIYYNSQF